MKKLILVLTAILPTQLLAQDYDLRPFPQTNIKSGMHKTVLSTGSSCPKVTDVWGVMQRGKFQNIAKIRCSDGKEYQVTEVGSRTFVKPWTGNLLGD